jgi:hypothetical protein
MVVNSILKKMLLGDAEVVVTAVNNRTVQTRVVVVWVTMVKTEWITRVVVAVVEQQIVVVVERVVMADQALFW